MSVADNTICYEPLSPRLERGEILLIDDSPSALSMLSSLLANAGFQVREAPDGEMALLTLQIRQPDLVLLDVRMPGLDGFEVCRRMKADPATRDIPVIFLSAQDETADKVLGLQVGAVDFIAKTFPEEEVFARLDTHIALARTKRALETERACLEIRVRERTDDLQRQRELLQTIIDSGPDLIYAVDREFRFIMANDNMARAAGLHDAASLIGRRDCDVLMRQECRRCTDMAACEAHADQLRVLAGETVFLPQEWVRLPNGNEIHTETHMFPLAGADGIPYGVLCYRRDISQRLAAEKEKQQLQMDLWQARKMESIGQLAGGIAHDFNNMLSLILGYAQIARGAIEKGALERIDGYLDEIMRAGEAGQTVVSQMLAYSRKDQPATEAVSPASAVEETVASFRPALGANITLHLDLEPDLPAVMIRKVQIQQVLGNLMLNARDALTQGGTMLVFGRVETLAAPRRCAACLCEFHGRYVALGVHDDGPGVSAEVAERMFDPFFTTKDVGQGAGLGLAMVHGIAHAVGGHVVLDSSAGSGTRIAILLPLPQTV